MCCVCPCERWLCVDDGDGRIERELHPLLPSEDKGAGQGVWSQWTVHVWTSDMRGAGTDANVSLQVQPYTSSLFILLFCRSMVPMVTRQ